MNLSLQVTLAFQTPTMQSQTLALPITVSVQNTADVPVTILRWNTPLDPQAGVLGVFELSDTTDQEPLDIPRIMVSRKLPASEEDLVEIRAHETLDVDVKVPVSGLKKGHQYSVRAQGTWHAVWPTEMSNVPPSELKANKGTNGGEFCSNNSYVIIE